MSVQPYICVLCDSGGSHSSGPGFIGSFKKHDPQEDYTQLELQFTGSPENVWSLVIRIEIGYQNKNGNRAVIRMDWVVMDSNKLADNSITECIVQYCEPMKNDISELQVYLSSFSTSSHADFKEVREIKLRSDMAYSQSKLFDEKSDFGSQTPSMARLRNLLRCGCTVKLLHSDPSIKQKIVKLQELMKRQTLRQCVEQWFNIGKESELLSMGSDNLKSPQYRPQNYQWRPRLTYESAGWFMLPMTVSNERERELESNQPTRATNIKARFFDIPNVKGRAFAVVIIPTRGSDPESSRRIRIGRKDLFWISSASAAASFQCIVSGKQVTGGMEIIKASVNGKWDTTTKDWIWPVDKLREHQTLRSSLLEAQHISKDLDCNVFTVRLKLSETTNARREQGLLLAQKIFIEAERGDQNSRHKASLMLGSNTANLVHVDLFGHLEGPVQDREKYINHIFTKMRKMTDEQSSALRQIRSVPGGVALLDGCAGSGKTYFMRHFICAHLFRKNQKGDFSKTIVAIEMNSTADVMVEKLQFLARCFSRGAKPEDEPIILRGHKIAHEKRVLVQVNGEEVKSDGKDDKRTILKPVPVNNIFMTAVHSYVQKKGDKRTKGAHIQIATTKVVNIENSVGWFMARFLGIVYEDDPLAQPDSYPGLLAELLKYYNHEFAAEPMGDLDRRLRYLLSDVLRRADVLVCTTTQALDPDYHEHFDAQIMAIDEASLVNDAVWAGLVACYKNVTTYVLAGDCRQNGVFSKYNEEQNPFHSQWIMPIQGRLQKNAFATAKFYEQQRCTYDIAMLLSEVFYGSDIVGRPDSRNRPLAVKLRQFNNEMFKLDKNVVFMDVPGAVCERVENGNSSENIQSAAVVKQLVACLGEHFEPRTIMTLAPYDAQNTHHINSVEGLAANDERFKDVESYTFKGVQGRENHICILDLTISHKIGFLTEESQTLVACSRGSDVLYIVGNRRGPGMKEAVGKLVRYCERSNLIYKWEKESFTSAAKELVMALTGYAEEIGCS